MFRNLSIYGLPLSGRPSELIELALSFGFEALDLDILDFQRQADAFGAEHARRLMVSARLKVGSFRLPVDLAADEATFADEMKLLPARLDVAQAAEASRAVATVEPASDDHGFKDLFELYHTRLNAVGEQLASRGIQLGLAFRPETEARAGKTHQFITTFEELLGLVTTAHAQVGAVVDAWALHVTGEPLDVIAKVPAGRLVEVRVSDAPQDVAGGDLTAEQRLMPGETGVIDAAAVVKAAQAAGFDGPVTPWANRATLAGRGREKTVRLAGERMEALWRAADLPIVTPWFMPVAKEEAAFAVVGADTDGAGEGETDKPSDDA
jgi:sugar phosphate isomerase/epimerase